MLKQFKDRQISRSKMAKIGGGRTYWGRHIVVFENSGEHVCDVYVEDDGGLTVSGCVYSGNVA